MNSANELLDIVDDNDKVIGCASKEKIYSDKLNHRIVHVLLFNDKGEMALQLRSLKCSFCPGHWSTAVGGHVSSGESYEEGALREYEEELGVLSDIDFLRKDIYSVNGLNKFIATFKTNYDGEFNINEDEVSKVEYFSLEKIKKMIEDGEKFHPELLFLLEKHLKL